MLPQPVGLLKLILHLFCTNSTRERTLLMKYAINMVLCQDTCQPVCFKLSMMLDTTKLYAGFQFVSNLV